MTAMANESTSAGPSRRWQFRLRTLLLVVTLLSALFAGANWWVTFPMRTWQAFKSRIESGDIDGANALCDPETLRVIPEPAPERSQSAKDNAIPRPPAAAKLSPPAQEGPQSDHGYVVELTPSQVRAIIRKSDVPFPRSFTDMLNGCLRFPGYLGSPGRFDVRRNKVNCERAPVPW